MDDQAYEAAAKLLGALAHKGRLAVLRYLDQHGPQHAGDLALAVGMEASALSHQLKVLRDVDLVRSERHGRHIVYSIADQHVAHIVADALLHASEQHSEEASV